jgi:thioredoxin reductase (NADPH)
MKIVHLKSVAEFETLKQTWPTMALDFYSDECPPCEKLAPIYEKMAEVFPSVLFVKAFRQENRDLAKSLDVSGSPALLFFKDGKLLESRLSGDIEESDLKNILQSLSSENNSDLNTETKSEIQKYDLAIIGNGPAGLTAAIYGARYKINQILIGDLPGGLMTSSHKICNFPSEIEISGSDLAQKMHDQVTALEVPQKNTRINSINQVDEIYNLILSNGENIQAKAILLATGTKHRHLDLPNEKSLVGRGVSYCATCDAMFYVDKVVAVIGGSDSANTAALHLAKFAKQVYQIYRGTSLRGETAWVDQVKANPKITVLYNTQVLEILGDKKVSGLKLSNGTELELDGVFVEIGSAPDTTLFDQLSLNMTEGDYIITQANQMTSRDGVWAAGDITTNSDSFQQIITACSEGAVAAQSIFKYLQSK